MPRAGLGGGDAHTAGVGEHVEQRLARRFGHDAAAGGAQVEEEPRVLPPVAGLDPIADAHLGEFPAALGRGQLVGRERVGDAGVAGAAVVVNQVEPREGAGVEGLQRVELGRGEGAVEALHQNQAAVAVDG